MEKYIQQVIDEEKECLNKFEQEENKKTLAQISEKVVETLKNGHMGDRQQMHNILQLKL